MLIRISKTNYSVQFILFVVVLIALWTKAFVDNSTADSVAGTDNGVFEILFGWRFAMPMLATVLAMTLILIQCLLINRIVLTNSLSGDPLIICLIYLLLTSNYASLQCLSVHHISNLFILGGLFYVFRLFDKTKAYTDVFNIGVLFAVASVFCAPLLWLWLIVVLAFFVYSVNTWREWVIALLGLAFPYIWLILILGVQNISLPQQWWMSFMLSQEQLFDYSSVSDSYAVFAGFVLLLSGCGVIYEQNHVLDKVIAQRKKIVVLIWAFLLSVVLLFVSDFSQTNLMVCFCFCPFLIAKFLWSSRWRKITETLFYALLLGSLVLVWC